MEAETKERKRILQRAEEAKTPHRILVPSLLKSRNTLREKYRELRAECKRWRNQAAAVERSRNTWRERAEASEAMARQEQVARAAVESQRQRLQEQLEQRTAELAESRTHQAARDEAEKKGP